MKRLQRLQRQKGFTLVELAIVMTIIGLLIGGILKGQALISNARVTAQIAQFNALQAAYTTFTDTYNGLAGDLISATTRIPNCIGGVTECFNGGGTGTVGPTEVTFPTPTMPANVPAGTITLAETGNFWIHLGNANLITGVSPAATLFFGGDLPFAKINTSAGLVVAEISGTPGNAGPNPTATSTMTGFYVSTTTLPTTAATLATTNTQAMTPSQAAQIDRKMDDGNPTTGSIIGTGASDCTGVTTANEYTESVTSYDCNISYQLQ